MPTDTIGTVEDRIRDLVRRNDKRTSDLSHRKAIPKEMVDTGMRGLHYQQVIAERGGYQGLEQAMRQDVRAVIAAIMADGYIFVHRDEVAEA